MLWGCLLLSGSRLRKGNGTCPLVLRYQVAKARKFYKWLIKKILFMCAL
jgi:hypothetical protein